MVSMVCRPFQWIFTCGCFEGYEQPTSPYCSYENLSTAVLPEIEFNTIKVVKGRAYHPASQGSVERGIATFKDALDKWLDD